MRLLVILLVGFGVTGCGTFLQTQPFPTAARQSANAYYALPRAHFPITFKRAKCDLSISIGQPTMLPDHDQKYEIAYTSNTWRNDTWIIQTDASGLLASVNSTSENAAGPIANKLMDIAGGLLKATADRSTDRDRGEPKDAAPCDQSRDFDISYMIDPTEAANATKLAKELDIKLKGRATVQALAQYPDEGTLPPLNPAPRCVAAAEKPIAGICFRPARTYKLVVILTEDVGGRPGKMTGAEFLLAAPDPRQVLHIPIEPETFAKFDLKLSFDKGMLTKVDSTNPSEALAALQIPADIIKGILGFDTSSGNSAASAPSKGSK